MIPEISSVKAHAGKPDIHVWMSVGEAAMTLGVAPPIVNRKIAWGELECRVGGDGTTQVLVCLPPRPEQKENTSLVQARRAVNASLMPIVDALRSAQAQDVRRARRWTRLAWATAAIMLLAVCTAGVLAQRAVRNAREQARVISRQLDQASASALAASADRDRVRGQLADARQAIADAQSQLAVERHVEDTLFKAARAAHAARQNQPGRAVLAGAE